MKIFKTAMVLTLIGLACGLLIGFSNRVTAPIIAENKRKAELKAYSAVFPGLTEASKVEGVSFVGTTYEVLEVKKGEEVVGFLIKGKSTNSYSEGNFIDILLGFDLKGNIVGVEFLELSQTANLIQVVKDNSEYYKNKNISAIDFGILLTQGKTTYDAKSGASFGSTTMRKIIHDAIKTYETLEIGDKYSDMFGSGAVATADSTFQATANVTKKEAVKINDAVVGYAYTVTSKRSSSDVNGFYYGTVEWNLTLLVGLDTEGKIKGIVIEDSDHTKGFINDHLAYFDVLEGKELATFDTVENTVTGATFSKKHIEDLLQALKGVLA